MINADELMIGNLFIGYNNKGFIWGLDHFDLLRNYKVDIDEIIKSPIAITEEWLLKFGFVEIYKSEFTWKFELEKHPSIEVKLLPNIAFYIKGQCLTLIENVHELQNLYSAITKQKLTLNPNFEKAEENSHSSLS